MSRYRQRKGSKTECECEQILKELGYKMVYNSPTPAQYTKNKDIHNTFDLLASNSQHHRYIQSKTNGTHGAKKKIGDWLKENQNEFPDNTIFEIWVRYEKKPFLERWQIHTWAKDKWIKDESVCKQVNYSCSIK